VISADPRVILVVLAFAATYWVGDQAVKGIKAVDHKVCNVLTLGHHCKPTTPPIVKPKG